MKGRDALRLYWCVDRLRDGDPRRDVLRAIDRLVMGLRSAGVNRRQMLAIFSKVVEVDPDDQSFKEDFEELMQILDAADKDDD